MKSARVLVPMFVAAAASWCGTAVSAESHKPDQERSIKPSEAASVDQDSRSRMSDEQRLKEFKYGEHRDQMREDALRDAHTLAKRRQIQQLALFQERMRRIVDLDQRGMPEMALAAARALTRDYPSSDAARAKHAELLNNAHEARRLDIAERNAEVLQEIQERIGSSLIPTVGLAGLYPDDWDERHTLLYTLDQKTIDTAIDGMNEALLQRTSFDVVDQDSIDLLKALAIRHHLNLVISPEATNAHKNVTLRCHEISLNSAIGWICRTIGMAWSQEDGAVYIGAMTQDKPVISLYDVSEIVFQVRDQVPRWELGITDAGNTPRTGSPIIVPGAAGDESNPNAIAPEDLLDLITAGLSPETWRRDDCSVQVRNQSLIVTAPPSVHNLVQQFLRAQMTRARLMVRLEGKWLIISDSFLEEIGVQWSTTNSILDLPGASTAGFRRTTSQFDHSGELLNNLPAAHTAPFPSTNGAGMTLSGILLRSLQLSATLTAIERNRKITLLDSTELYTFNAVRAYAFQGTTYTYPSGLEPSTQTQGGLIRAPSPAFSTILLGNQLDIRPIVSSDRKYVQVEIGATRATLVGGTSEDLTVQSTFPVGFDPGGNNGQGAPILGTATSTSLIDLPIINLNRIQTYVLVPDGGTILVGGMGEYVEQSMSTKVPALGHIPFIGRLFGQRGRYSDRMKLSFLMTVNIIPYDEWEQRQ